MPEYKMINGKMYKAIYCRFTRKNGKIYYSKNGKVFKFWVKANKAL